MTDRYLSRLSTEALVKCLQIAQKRQAKLTSARSISNGLENIRTLEGELSKRFEVA